MLIRSLICKDSSARLAPMSYTDIALATLHIGALSQNAKSRLPVFFHDHKLFCPREHKYTTLTQQTCSRCVGLRCYSCLGMVNKSSRWPGIKFNRVGRLLTEQAVSQKLAAFVVGSDYMATHLADHGFASHKTHVLPLYAMPPESGQSDDALANHSEPIPRQGDLLLFVGQLTRGKGIDILLKAMSLTTSPARLEIVGQGPQEEELRRQSCQLGLENRVAFLGKMAPAALSQRYQEAACLVLPSRSPETFGLVGVEAMSYATPVIATDVGGITQWLDDQVNGLLVPSGDVSALAIAIDRCVADPYYTSQLGQNAYESYESDFRPDQHIDSLVHLFHELSPSRLPSKLKSALQSA